MQFLIGISSIAFICSLFTLPITIIEVLAGSSLNQLVLHLGILITSPVIFIGSLTIVDKYDLID